MSDLLQERCGLLNRHTRLNRIGVGGGPRRRRFRDGSNTMSDDFEDHCWKDIVTPDVLEVYSCYRRKVFVGASPALLAVDLYDVVYRGGARPPAELAKTHPNSCGEYAFAAIEPTKRLFAAARAAGLPIFIRLAIRARRAAQAW